MKKIILILFALAFIQAHSQGELCVNQPALSYFFIDNECPTGQKIFMDAINISGATDAEFVVEGPGFGEGYPATIDGDRVYAESRPYEEGTDLEFFVVLIINGEACVSYRMQATVPSCSPGCSDSDGDGVCDEEDICPGENDLADADGDSIPDGCDNCPNLANPGQETDLDCDGIPANIDCNDNDPSITGRLDLDTDGDGTPDCLDECLNDPAKILPGICGCGVRENTKDSDKDGILDCVDQEPRSPCPLNVDSFGVSIDSDSDGVPDCNDVCPGGDDKIDTDGDKIPDACDNNKDCRGDKVTICHNRNGVYVTLCVSPGQVQRHLGHGDTLGPCSGATVSEVIYETEEMIASEQKLSISPNPAGSELSFQINFRLNEHVSFSIYNLNGQLLKSGSMLQNNLQIDLGEEFVSGNYLLMIQDGKNKKSQQFSIRK